MPSAIPKATFKGASTSEPILDNELLEDISSAQVSSAQAEAQSVNLPETTGATWPLVALAWLAIGAVLYLGKAAFAPIPFAILLAMLLSPPVDFMERHRVPRMLASLLAVGIVIGSLTLIIDTAWNPALRWADDAPTILQTVEQKIRPLQRVVARVESLTTRATTLTSSSAPRQTLSPQTVVSATPMDALAISRTLLIDTVTISILTIFLLLAGARTLRSIESALVGHGKRYQCMRIVEGIRSELSRYFATLALINVGLGLVTTGVMALWGLPNPWLWGIIAGVLNFIPYVGPTVTLVVLSVVSLVSFAGYGTAIGVAGSFLLITTIEGQIIQPLLIGFRLNLNPIVLFIAIWLAGWFWGITGVLLATPVLITLKEIANRQQGASVLKALLSGHLTAIGVLQQNPPRQVVKEEHFPL